jgi:arginine-tRNA-protein transferase
MLLPLEYHFPDDTISARRLDKLLATGYFRTGNYLMRTRVLYFNDQILNTLHIRIQLSQHQFTKSLQKILRRNNSRFTYQIQPYNITIEKELLYKAHRKRFKGNASASLSGFMYDNHNKNIFNTFEINIYENDRLIGFSFFDVGITSMASIIGIFDQDYAKCSIGIYTMLLEMEYAKSMGLKYYYPGYVAYEPSQFNYKLRLSDTFEFYDWYSKRWISFDKRDKKVKVNDFFNEKMTVAKSWLEALKLPYKELFYPYFYMGSMYTKSDCVKGVHHLQIQDFDIDGLYYIVEFHPEKMELVISGVTIHKYQFEEYIDLNESHDHKRWKRVLLYLHPQIIVRNEFELYAGYMFLKDLFRQHLHAQSLPNGEIVRPNLHAPHA